ncbi:helix-turn-helix domain-containing protein [Budviciaceae bacterium CWB-B4]|uniref:Helix-turn-helix domain-containing protein n=1 Tax=Limnobaculum xujianqingii TaxID=2738837 RepID=A0A9D7AFD7_9GAMM|nr:helix-turn-helix domain-containing protein [Limnobaculum xujianqingii]MBK5071725.1 helix-turn-helix domain-containing protein [Limnobaculum xujianqingii]MBK5175034.1 helix-turn-helix domain-containing protein [Limnobaculum xujianqingii]
MNKPSDEFKTHIKILLDAFLKSDSIEEITIKKGNKYPIVARIFCIQKGVFSVYMNREDRLLSYVEGPAILGLAYLYTPTANHYMKANETSTILTLPTREAHKIIKEENLYESFICIQSHNVALIFEMYERTITSSNYAFIRALLIDLDQNSNAVKESVTVASYIIKRSGLSRSYVMLVLSELRKGDYIRMEDGKLTGITSLPERF